MSPIKIKTMPNHEVQLSAFDPSSPSFVKYDGSVGVSDSYGDFYWNFSSEKSKFNLRIFIKKDGEKVMGPEDYEDYKSGDSVYIEIAPDWFEFIDSPKPVSEINETNVTLSNITIENTTIQETPKTNTSVTGNAINLFSEGGIFRKATTYYIVGGVVLLVVAWFIIRLILKNKNMERIPKEIRIRKLSELKQEQVQKQQENNELKAAEEELRLAQEKISTIRNKERIDELRQEITGKEEELRRLRGDSN